MRFTFLISVVFLAQFLQGQNSYHKQATSDFPSPAMGCADPSLESQIFGSIEGTAIKVVSSKQVTVSVRSSGQLLDVKLLGLELETENENAGKARVFLKDALLNKEVRVRTKQSALRLVLGTIILAKTDSSDIGIALLQQGLARFSKPEPYTMSEYMECQYRRAEEFARLKKLGIWK